MLNRQNRLVSSRLFGQAVRRGQRAGTGTMVVHLLAATPFRDQAPPQVGFVVSKAVGPAVTRNLVKRRLRHIARERLASLPGPAVLVVRALPAAANASYASLAADFEAMLAKAARRAPSVGSVR